MSQRNIPEVSFEVYDVVTLLNVGMSHPSSEIFSSLTFTNGEMEMQTVVTYSSSSIPLDCRHPKF